MKKLIFIEMIVLSVLLVVAVLISAKLDEQPTFSQNDITASSDAATDTATENQTATETEETQTDTTGATIPADHQLTAKQYFVYDCNDRAYLLNSGTENDRIYPASITKLFTAYVAMYYLHPDAYYVIGDAIDMIDPDSSVAHLQKGDRLTARQLIEGMLLTSGNDAAYVLATEAGRVISGQADLDNESAVAVFMEEMNKRAKTLGMPNTHFTNPDGIHDPDHYTTPADLVTLASLCMTDNTIMRNAVVPEADITLHGETVVWRNTNALINPDSPYYSPYALGLKTGQTSDAGSCLLSVFRKDGQFLIIGVFGSTSHTDRFADTLQLFNPVTEA